MMNSVRASPQFLAAPGRELERALVGGAVVHRVAVRNDYPLEGELEQRAERRQRSLLMPRRRPNAQLAARRRQRVGENERALLGKPQWRLVAATSVIKGDEATG